MSFYKPANVKNVTIEEDVIFIDCYRIKVEFRDGKLRIYCLNSRKKGGDSCLLIDGEVDSIELTTEQGTYKEDEVLHTIYVNPSKRNTPK